MESRRALWITKQRHGKPANQKRNAGFADIYRFLELSFVDDRIVFALEANDLVVLDGEGDEDVGTDGYVVADDGIPAQDRSARIDDDVVLDGRMTLLVAESVRMVERLRAEGDALVDADIVADLRGLADDDAGAVVDEEAMADGRARMDVDACRGMSEFAHHTRKDFNAMDMKNMRNAMNEQRIEARVGRDDLFFALRRRITEISRVHVFIEHRFDGDEVFVKVRERIGRALLLHHLVKKAREVAFFLFGVIL